ncbi:MAG: hypothetical protein HYY45_06065 [Deltaproteobacteria bacterium]|nr:hypothetical protein [Deltaproteobacteria bacterium]
MFLISLTLGLGPAPNTQSLIDGVVRPKGIDLRVQTQFCEGYDNVGTRHRWIIEGKIDGGELSISSFILARLRGVRLRAFPVFLSRRFRHRCFYCPVNSPLRDPSELAGKKVTVHRYNATTPVWLKGILQNEYRVRLQSVEWYVAEPDIAEESLHPPAPEIRVRFIPSPHTREHAIELLEQEKLDAALEPYAALSTNPKLRHIFPDFRKVEEEFFHHTGAFPINHLLVLREHFAEEHPWIVDSLLTAFREAESAADQYRSEKEKAEVAWERKVMGGPFAYSLKKGPARRSLAILMEYQIQQGILDQKPDIESLFFPDSLDL